MITLAQDFWDNPSKCPVNDDGVLQGYGKLTPLDSRDSNIFLDVLSSKYPQLKLGRAADCGAGIGRVTKHFLLGRFQHVDLIEQSSRLSAATLAYVGLENKQRITKTSNDVD